MNKIISSIIFLTSIVGSITVFAAPNGQEADNKISTTVSIKMNVNEVKADLSKIEAIVEQSNGYSLNTGFSIANNESRSLTGQISIRVPKAHFNTVLEEIKSLSSSITSMDKNSQNLTETYVKAQSDLSTKEIQMKALTTLMTKASKSKDVLSVFNALTTLQSDMNQLEGQLSYINSVTELPKMSITLSQSTLTQTTHTKRWQVFASFNNGTQYFLNAINIQIKMVLYFIIYFLPLMLIWGFIFYILYLFLRFMYKRYCYR